MSRKKYIHSFLIMTLLTMIIALSAVCVLAESSVRITWPVNGCTVTPGSIDVYNTFDTPTGNWDSSTLAADYLPVVYKLYKGSELQDQDVVYQGTITFTAEGGYSTSFNIGSEGTYTLTACVPKTADEWDSVTFNVAKPAKLTEGVFQKCELTASSRDSAVYEITPEKSGKYIFLSSGAPFRVRGSVYDGEERIARESGKWDLNDFIFYASLNANTTYTLTVDCSSANDKSSFNVGYFRAGAGQVMLSDSELTLTDENNGYELNAYSDNFSIDKEWISSDDSVVDFSESGGWSSGDEGVNSLSVSHVKLRARKNGSATVYLINYDTKEILASCNVTCKNVTEYYDLYVGGVQVSDKNASNITGDGISGKVSYDKDSNTLYLNNAMLSAACRTEGFFPYSNNLSLSAQEDTLHAAGEGDWVEYFGAINHVTKEPFKIHLTGTNRISNVKFINDSENDYDATLSYTGLDGVASYSSVEFTGDGTLSIDSSNIGTAVNSKHNVTVAQGATLNIKETNNTNSNGIVSDEAVIINGNVRIDGQTSSVVVEGNKTCVTGYGIKAGQVQIGSKANTVINESTNCDATSYCIMLNSGGSADISGSFEAKAVGSSGEKAGVAIGAGKEGTKVSIAGTGRLTLQGNKSALSNITLSAASGIVVKAGSSASDVRAIAPSAYKGEVYLVATQKDPCKTHKLNKVAAKEATEEEEGNTEYWVCSECGKMFSDSNGKNEITEEDTVIPRLPRTDSSLYISSPRSGSQYDVGDTIKITAYSDVYVFTYISGILIPNAPNYIYVTVTKDGNEVAHDTLRYYEAGEDVSTSFTASASGKYVIQVSKRSDFSSLKSVEIQVGQPTSDGGSDTPSGGGSNTPSGGGSDTPSGGGGNTPSGGGSDTPSGGGSNTPSVTVKEIKPSIKLSKTSFTWNKKVQTPKITVMDGTTVLKKNTDYTVSLPKGRKNIGTYTIKIKLTGSYKGEGSAVYKIVPKGAALSSVKAAKKALTIKWKKQTAKMPTKQITGYQVQYSTSKNFKKAVKSKVVKGFKKDSVKITKLTSKKTYYVRVRTFMKIGKKTYYSDWSKVKKAKVK